MTSIGSINFSAFMSGLDGLLGLMNTATTISNIVMSKQLQNEVKKYQKEYKLMSKFGPILKTFENMSTINSQMEINTSQAINNWNLITNNLKSLTKLGIQLIQKYPDVKPPNTLNAKTWIGFTVTFAFSAFQVVNGILEIKNRSSNIEKFKQEYQQKQQNIQTDAQTKHRSKESKTKGKGQNKGLLVEESGNLGPKSRQIAKKQGNIKKIWKKVSSVKWTSVLSKALRVVGAAAAIYSFTTSVIGLNELQGQIQKYRDLLSFGGSMQQDQQNLVELLEAMSQDMYTTAICSYISIQDLQQSFVLLSQQSPFDSTVLKKFANKFNPQTLVPGFNYQKITELSLFTTQVNKAMNSYKAFKERGDKSQQEKKDQLDRTLNIIYAEFIKYEPSPEDIQNNPKAPKCLSSIFNDIASQISRNISYTGMITTDMTNKATLNNTFIEQVESKFIKRRQRMKKTPGLEDRLNKNELIQSDRKALNSNDKMTFKNIFDSYYSFIYNVGKKSEDQISLSDYDDDEFKELLVTMDKKIKEDVVFEIQKRCERFFYDDWQGDLKTIGYSVVGIPFKKEEDSYKNKNMKALPNMLIITPDMTIFESQSELKTILKQHQTSIPQFRESQVKEYERAIWIIVPQKTSILQNQQTGQHEKITFRPIVYWKGLLMKMKAEPLTYYRLYAKELFSKEWFFEKYTVSNS